MVSRKSLILTTPRAFYNRAQGTLRFLPWFCFYEIFNLISDEEMETLTMSHQESIEANRVWICSKKLQSFIHGTESWKQKQGSFWKIAFNVQHTIHLLFQRFGNKRIGLESSGGIPFPIHPPDSYVSIEEIFPGLRGEQVYFSVGSWYPSFDMK